MKACVRRFRSGFTSRPLIVLALVCAFLVPPLRQPALAAAATTANARVAGASAATDAAVVGSPSERWLITWDASTDANVVGTKSYDDTVTIMLHSRVTARIVVNFYADGSSEYYANTYTASYVKDMVRVGNCYGGGSYRTHIREQLMDPPRYDGIGPVTPNTVMAYKPTLWVGTKLTTPGVNLILGGFTMDHTEELGYCGGEDRHYESDADSLGFTSLMTSAIRSPFNSDDDGVFRYDVATQVEQKDFGVTYPVTLVEHLKIELLTARDLSVRDLEVTQGLQLQNTIPLVQGRRTIVRAYIDIGTEAGPIANVTGRLKGYDQDILLGELQPFNRTGSISARRSPNWRNLDDTLNFELPNDWPLLPEIRLEFEVNPGHEIGEHDYTNNIYAVTLPLRNCRPLKIAYLPIRYAPPGQQSASPDADIARGQQFLRKVYPVADEELIYKPWPGITWDKPIDGATFTDTISSADSLLKTLLVTLAFNTGRTSPDRLVGWMPGSASEQINGISNAIPGEVAWVGQNKNPNLWRATFAHELGHTYGLYHNALTTGGYHWIDVYARTIKPPRADGKLLDFIYTPGVPEEERWVSPQSYVSLFDRFCPSGAAAESQAAQTQASADLLMVAGSVSLTDDQSGELDPLYRFTGEPLTPSPDAYPRYHLVLKNGTTVLATYGFDTDQEVEAPQPITPTIAPFVFALPYPAGTNRVELTDQYNHVLTSRIASAHPPTITVRFPNEAGLTLDGLQTIQWTGGDRDGDPLSYSVLYSADAGATWTAVGTGLTGTSYEADFDTFPGSSTALIKVLASDGFLTASDVSDQPFSRPAKPPVPTIIAPPAGAVFKVGEQIKLQGYAVDLEDGMLGADSLSWSSDRDGALGTGSTREAALSEGTHTITLTAVGNTQGVTTTVVIEAPPSPSPRSYTYLPLTFR